MMRRVCALALSVLSVAGVWALATPTGASAITVQDISVSASPGDVRVGNAAAFFTSTPGSYSWDFGPDATPRFSSSSLALARFSTPGDHIARLTVTGIDGTSATKSFLVPVHSGNIPPLADMSFESQPSVGASNGFFFADAAWDEFDDLPSSSPLTRMHIDFGDGETIDRDTSSSGNKNSLFLFRKYTAAGDFLLTATVTDAGGLSDTIAAMVHAHAGSLDPTAPASKLRGSPFRGINGLRFDRPAPGGASPVEPRVGVTYPLDASNFINAVWGVRDVAWDFGDGTQGTGAQTTHRWTTPGRKLVKVTLTDQRGASDTEVTTINVHTANAAPIAESIDIPDLLAPGQAFVATGGGTDPDSPLSQDPAKRYGITSVQWDFGDGSTGTGWCSRHAYTAPGDYVVKATMSDADGARDVFIRSISVRAGVPAVPVPVVSCSPAPDVITQDAAKVTQTSATLGGVVNPNGLATTYRFQYGTTTQYGASTPGKSAGAGARAVTVAAPVTGLKPGTVYHFRVVATNSGGTTLGEDQTFTTSAVIRPPKATTAPADTITATGARLKGTVNPNGTATTYRFEYGKTTAYGAKTGSVNAGAGTSDLAATAALQNLASGTTYHYRVVAVNAAGTTVGADRSFTTLAAPAVTTGAASAITATSAKLAGTVNPKGRATTYQFEYGKTSGYGAKTPVMNAGGGTNNAAVAAALSSLAPATTYHYRIVATSSAGRSLGADRTFTTLQTATFGSDLSGTPIGVDAGCGRDGLANGQTCTGVAGSFPAGNAHPAVAPLSGVITRLRIKSATRDTFVVRIVRLDASGKGRAIATGPTLTTAGAGKTSAFAVRIPAKAGDSLGGDGARTRAIACDGGRDYTYTPALVNGGAARAPSATIAGCHLLFNADIEIDADGDGYGDKTQDRCPGRAGSNNGCPAGVAREAAAVER